MQNSAQTRDGDYWESHASTWQGFHVARGLSPRAIVGWFISGRQAALVEMLAGCTGRELLLDIGCGGGDTMQALRPLVRQVIGADASRPLLLWAQKAGPVIHADAHHLPFQNGSCDIALATGLFDYVTDPERVLSELVRVTRPAGRVIITYPERPSLFDWLRRGWGARIRWLLFRLPPIENAVTWDELTSLATRAGLSECQGRSLWGASWLLQARRP
jgi:SAM-dependent methyltransferase